MTTKKISKVIVYYEDGTYEEIKAGVSGVQSEPNKKDASPGPVIPDFRPDTQKMREWQPNYITWPSYQPYYTQPARDPWPYPWKPGDIWCTATDSTTNIPLRYTVNSENGSWNFTSTGNFGNDNKYTITSTGNGNVDLSK